MNYGLAVGLGLGVVCLSYGHLFVLGPVLVFSVLSFGYFDSATDCPERLVSDMTYGEWTLTLKRAEVSTDYTLPSRSNLNLHF